MTSKLTFFLLCAAMAAAAANLTVSSGTLPAGTVGSPWPAADLSATGGSPPYTWTPTGGLIPPGLSLDPTGALTGTPTAAGPFQFGARVTDSSGAMAAGAFTVTINAAPLQITTPAVLPSGIAGADYPDQILGATGGTPPYTFSVQGSLPGGLQFSNNEINGTPQSAGTFAFTLTVTDATKATASAQEQIAIRPAGVVDLLLGAGGAAFSLATGSTGLPPAIGIPVSSSLVTQPLGFSVTLNPSVPWLMVPSATTTPGTISVALSSQALSLAASAIPYRTSLVVTCASGSPCAGNTQTIAVSVAVTSPPAQLSVDTAFLAFTGSASNPPVPQILSLRNIGGGSLAIASITAADNWVQVGSAPASLAAGTPAGIAITANTAGLANGFYQSSIAIVTSGGRATVPVSVLVSGNPTITLGPAGLQFAMSANAVPGDPNESFLVSATGSSPVSFTASLLPGAPWLLLQTASGAATVSNPATVNFALDPVAVGALAAGSYYATIRVTAPGAVNSPQDFQMVLSVAAPTSAVLPDLAPEGLLFIAGTGAVSQTVAVFASSASTVPYQSSASTADGGSWLSVTPATGSTSASKPGHATVTVNLSGLPAGVYRGFASYGYIGSAIRTVNVTLIVPATYTGYARTAAAVAISCPGAQLVAVPAAGGTLNNFATPASWPVPLAVSLVDSCGNPVSNGQITATFSNNDPALALALVNGASGLYSGTWTPRNAAAGVTITATASAPGFTASTAQISGQVRPNAAPLVVPNGVTDIFNPQIGGALAPGTVVQIYGSNLAGSTVTPATLPLPKAAAGTSVIVGGIAAPLFFSSSGQINAQIPYELTPGMQYQVIINANGALTTPTLIQLNSVAPGVLNAVSGEIYAQRLDGSFVSDAAPAKPGEPLVIYLLAMGATDNPAVATGAGAPGLNPGDKLANALIAPTLTLNGEALKIAFAGLTPGAVGLYQVNFTVAPDAPDGNLALVLTQNGAAANETLLPVQH